MEKEYISCADTAKLIRVALKKAFPGIKFSVVSDVYSGGASIDIGWVLGPTTSEVDKVGKQYSSADFDGSIDMEVYSSHWLLPDGTVRLRRSEGSQGSGGYLPAVAETTMPEGAKPVSFGAHYVFTQRRYAPKGQDEMVLRREVAKGMCELQHIEYTGDYTTHLYGQHDDEQVDQHAWRLLQETSFAPDEVYAGVKFRSKEQLENLHHYQPFEIVKAKAAVNEIPKK